MIRFIFDRHAKLIEPSFEVQISLASFVRLYVLVTRGRSPLEQDIRNKLFELASNQPERRGARRIARRCSLRRSLDEYTGQPCHHYYQKETAMRMSIRLFLYVLLVSVSSACLSSQARSERQQETTKRIALKPAEYPSPPHWRASTPVRFEKLIVFPVISDEATDTSDLITLDEGLRAGTIAITELGANGRSRTIRPHERLSDNAEVNKLSVINNSGKTLVLIAGEMILGGKQDRIVGHDCIIESSNTAVPLDVFCVEHGRWSGGQAFGQSAGSSGSSSSTVGGSGSPTAVSAAPMALPNVREKAEAKKSQGDVWGAVAETVTVTAASSSTGALTSVYNDKRVNKQVDNYVQAFKDKFSGRNIVGVVAAVGGEVISADVFANHLLFQAYWPKMLKSYALQAVATTKVTAKEVSGADAEAFLTRVQGTSASDGRAGLYRLAENQSKEDASFELEYTKNKATLVHFNRVSKK